MATPEDHALAALLLHWRRLPPDRIAACTEAAARASTSLPRALAGVIPEDELGGAMEAARYLVAGRHLSACARCLVEVMAPPGKVPRCPECSSELLPGAIADARAVVADPALDQLLRRLVADVAARIRTRQQVDQARRLREDGRIAPRPEAELAPTDRAPAATPAARAEAPTPVDPSAAVPVLGPYELHALVGRGSASYVYKARDRRNHSLVALKVLYFTGNEGEAEIHERVARLQRESDLASKLEHPNLVRSGPLEQTGNWWHLAMTFIDGPTLDQVLQARKTSATAAGVMPPLADLATLGQALCDIAQGLHYAHCQSVVHRDVNPRNILFAADGRVFLADFGSAKVIGGAARLTGMKTIVGARPYAAPERILSEQRAFARSDVYSLGVILYEIVTGRLPFADADPERLAQRIVHEPPEPPSRVNPEVTPELETVILRAMEKDPAKRFPTAQDFADALAGCLPRPESVGTAEAVASVVGRSAGVAADAVDRGVGWAREMVVRAGWGVVAIESALVFFVGYWLAALLAKPADIDRLAPLRPAQAALARLFAAKSGWENANARKELDASIVTAEAGLGRADPDLLLLRGRSALAAGRLADAEADFARAASSPARRLTSAFLHGLAAHLMGERHGGSLRAKAWHDAARQDFNVVYEIDAKSYEGRFAQGMLRLDSGEEEAAAEMFHHLASEDPSRPEAFLLEARTLLHRGAPKQTLETVFAAVRVHPTDPWLLLAEAQGYAASGDAAKCLERLGTLRPRFPEFAEAAMLEARQQLGGEPEKSLEAAERLLTADPELAQAHWLRGLALAQTGDACRAVDAYGMSLVLEPGAPDALYQRGMLLWEHGDRERARSDLQGFLSRAPSDQRAAGVRARLEGK